MNEDFIKELFREFDHDEDGTLTRYEAEQAALSFGINNVEHVDTDGSGCLDEGEIRRMLDVLNIKISDEDLRRFMQAADLNNDGQIDTKEYVAFLKSIFKKSG
ncbi:hypothetical protein Ciccas_006927 [Cichlidogyrus casuarinus]|uniref:EF-hand domain-containing protein n=1 Tax=Cichlidogyrus casuarinus TaxID=1844966 RepID=A0ABD2Q4B7_9PLAT